MNRLFFVVAVLASTAFAQDAAPPVELAHPWSFGTGYGLGGVEAVASIGSLLSGSSLGVLGASAYTPYATVNIERRLTAKTSLIGGLYGTVSSSNSPRDTVTNTYPMATAYGGQSAAIGLGVRQQLSSGGGLVTLSGSATASFGYTRIEQTSTYLSGMDTVVTTTVANGGRVGLELGVAAERTLVDQLAVRFSLSLLDAGYSAGRSTSYDGTTSTPFSHFGVSLPLAPSLELRLYF